MTYSYNGNSREGVQALSTFDAIINGERTSTTRYKSNKAGYEMWQNM
jgi:hypothetical protein